MMGTVQADHFSHEALLYSDMDEYLAGTLAFIREGLAASEPILVVVGSPKIAALKAQLGPDAGRVEFKNMADVGANPARIIPAWHQFVESHAGAGRPFRGIGAQRRMGRVAAHQLGQHVGDPLRRRRQPGRIDVHRYNFPSRSRAAARSASVGMPAKSSVAMPACSHWHRTATCP